MTATPNGTELDAPTTSKPAYSEKWCDERHGRIDKALEENAADHKAFDCRLGEVEKKLIRVIAVSTTLLAVLQGVIKFLPI